MLCSFPRKGFRPNYFVGKELPPPISTPGTVLPAEVEPEQAEGINLWLYFRFESQDERSTFLNGN